MFWFPVIGNLRVNDMISLLVAYTLMAVGAGWVQRLDWRRESQEIWHALTYFLTVKNGTFLLVFFILGFNGLGLVDRLLLARYTLPMHISSVRQMTVLLPELAPFLQAVSLLLVNGIVVPVSEEYLWRGLVQVRLTRIVSPVLAIGATAVMFSLKHVLVDASFGRFLAIVFFGAMCGVVAHRRSWKTSAALHILINTASTLGELVFG